MQTIATDVIETAAGIHALDTNYSAHIQGLIADIADGLTCGELTLAETNDKGLSEIKGDCDLRTLFQFVRNESDEYGKQHANDPKEQKKLASAVRTKARNNILKSQCKTGLKKVITPADEAKPTEIEAARSAALSNECGNPRYISISLGTPKDPIAKIFLTEGAMDAEFNLEKEVSDLLEKLKTNDCTIDAWRGEFNKQARASK